MQRVLMLPILILAGLAVFSFVRRADAPEPEPHQYIMSGTPGLVSTQAYLFPAVYPGYAPIRDTTVPEFQPDASAALLYDVDTGSYLYEKNSNVRVPIASLTKVLSALVTQDLFDDGEVVTVASGSVRVDGQKQTLYDGERISVHNLVSMMLVESSNDAAYALARYAAERGINFVAQMNNKAQGLGMTNCIFTDPAGLDDTAVCTAHDLVRLVQAALKTAPRIWPIMATRELTVASADGKLVHTLKTTDELLGQIEGIIGAKTGYTDGALGCLILVVKVPHKGDTLVSIVLGSRSRFGDTKALLDWVAHAYHWQ